MKVFGIRGEIVLQPMTDRPKRFAKLRTVFVGRHEGRVAKRAIERVCIEDRGIRMKLAGVDDRTTAQQLVGAYLFVDDAHRAQLPSGRYFVHEVLGLQVVDQQGRELGTVAEVMKMPAHDVYVVRRGKKELLLPAVKEYITRIDLDARTMQVRLIEGMDNEDAD